MLFPPGRLSLNASLEARQAVVTVDLDGSTATLNQAMTLSGQGSVRARLVTSEGQALPGAEARLISSRTSQVRFTDPDGSVRFDAVPAGDVEVSFQSPNSLVERALWQGTLAAGSGCAGVWRRPWRRRCSGTNPVKCAGVITLTEKVGSRHFAVKLTRGAVQARCCRWVNTNSVSITT